MNGFLKQFTGVAAGVGLVILTTAVPARAISLIDLDFNSGVDSFGDSQGDLVFNGLNGFQVTFTDDNSSGSFGGNADGVHITNLNAGNIKVGSSTDLVLGAFNSFFSSSGNYHSSGIVAHFNQGVQAVSLDDTDNDSTVKALFAFNENDDLIGQTVFGSGFSGANPFKIDTSMTGGQLIHSIEFDTAAGSAGGSFDGTFFTIDNFSVEGTPRSIPDPSAILGLLALGTLGARSALKRQLKQLKSIEKETLG